MSIEIFSNLLRMMGTLDNSIADNSKLSVLKSLKAYIKLKDFINYCNENEDNQYYKYQFLYNLALALYEFKYFPNEKNPMSSRVDYNSSEILDKYTVKYYFNNLMINNNTISVSITKPPKDSIVKLYYYMEFNNIKYLYRLTPEISPRLIIFDICNDYSEDKILHETLEYTDYINSNKNFEVDNIKIIIKNIFKSIIEDYKYKLSDRYSILRLMEKIL